MDKSASFDSDATELQQELLLLGPIFEKLVFTSDPLRKTYEQLWLVVYLKVPGCWLAAARGRGKTIAIEYCARRLRAEIPGLPVFIINEQILPGNELRSFFIRALAESGHDKPVSRDTTALRHRLPMYWAELSRYSPIGCVVVLLDECQSMRDLDMFLMKDLSNEIARMGGSLMTIAFGESPSFEALISQKTALMNDNGAVDRLFGGRQLKLFGYESESDWVSLFSEMDSMIFEELGNRSIAQAYFSHMDMSALRLANEAVRFCKALRMAQGRTPLIEANLRRVFVGIRHAMVTTALKSIDKRLTSITEIPIETWKEGLDFAMNSK